MQHKMALIVKCRILKFEALEPMTSNVENYFLAALDSVSKSGIKFKLLNSSFSKSAISRETYSVACSDISEDEGFSNPKLTQSDDELLSNVSKIESKSHQPSTSRFHEPKTDKEIEDMQSKKKQTALTTRFELLPQLGCTTLVNEQLICEVTGHRSNANKKEQMENRKGKSIPLSKDEPIVKTMIPERSKYPNLMAICQLH
ncbi:unnamed protein product [Mytilus coruscus]|uniref:Uncharacterized protein n=1 Tax=Mytilus coruscus TaxID=42192 RepID=A0A6J8BTE4_MYTCO|nr:unnamed protein product [Mytilus coruscus]